VSGSELKQLIASFQETRDLQIFDDILRRVHRPIWGLLAKGLNDPSLADDLFQEFSVRLWKNLDDLRADGNPFGWMCTTAQNVKFTHFRRLSTKKNTVPEFIYADEQQSVDRWRAEMTPQLSKCFAQLSDEHRELLSVYYLDAVHGSREEHAATELRWSTSKVKKQILAARRSLATCLGIDLGKKSTK
jgi:RNA polymerase sigma factor (sigma-70 family)